MALKKVYALDELKAEDVDHLSTAIFTLVSASGIAQEQMKPDLASQLRALAGDIGKVIDSSISEYDEEEVDDDEPA